MNEAWIFLSIGDAGGCDRLVGREAVIAMADAINHQLPTTDELADAVASLVAAGLVAVGGDDHALTEVGCRIYRRESASGRGHIARFLELDARWAHSFPPIE
jgi:hypothetical protein